MSLKNHLGVDCLNIISFPLKLRVKVHKKYLKEHDFLNFFNYLFILKKENKVPILKVIIFIIKIR